MQGESNQVWVTCEGQSPHDKDNIKEVRYFPGPGFPYYFYPYKNTKDYMSPLVAVQFNVTGKKKNSAVNRNVFTALGTKLEVNSY